ncbi:actinorhodin polyketide synthase [Streptomyces sp. RerS4]|uniref:actinorhodin polyketide synthase n=1 Tax=Streptomyces sp. RerS4 TaxID=2942449 RepID=UPI00201C1AC6|nr:actinorhodin polyketide synthase [Streptomyces sp. RerS4]UQX05321.1 actinorhodin polyketide synthase [Streptomyces sp. RerS4]
MDRLDPTTLTRILRAWDTEEEGVDLTDDVLDLYWVELGYDCLSVFQTTGWIERRFAILLDGDALEQADTPRRYLRLVNAELDRKSRDLPAVADRLCIKR